MNATTPTRRATWLMPYAIAVFAFIYLPVVVLVGYSFNRDGVGGFPPRHFTLHWYGLLFADDAIWDAVLNSLLVAAGSVALALTLGLLAALALDRADFPGKALFRWLLYIPVFIPDIVMAVAMLLFIDGASDTDIVQTVQEKLMPSLLRNHGEGSIAEVSTIRLLKPVRVMRNYLPFVNMENGYIKKDWPDEAIYVGK